MQHHDILYYENFDMDSLVTPVNPDVFECLLKESNYDPAKTKFVVNGFRHRFSLGYRGPTKIKLNSPNLKLNVGDEIELWNKVMKEVRLKRYAGPFKTVPFHSYIQLPIGLVPKDNGQNTRLIFHLSYPRTQNSPSVNANTPESWCKVRYPDITDAIKLCLKEANYNKVPVFIARSDVSAAFQNLCISCKYWRYLVMKAKNPIDQRWYYFFDKCLAFGASISCSHYQKVSNAVTHILKYRTNKDSVNYLDDNFFVQLIKSLCDHQVEEFLKICNLIGLPISIDKTFWGSTLMIFLGFLIDTVQQRVLIPCEKRTHGINMIRFVLEICKSKKAVQRKITVHQLQSICGFLNFLGRVIVPGRAFTRRLYAPLSSNLKPHYHVRVTKEMQSDLQMWEQFLLNQAAYCRPFADFEESVHAKDISFAMDASKNSKLGFGGHCGSAWMQQKWGSFITEYNPSIQYLELFALTAGVLTWVQNYPNKTLIIYTDNKSVRSMVNHTTSGCKNCMVLIRKLVLHCLIHNVKLKAVYLKSSKNKIADSLSRFQDKRFNKLAKKYNLDSVPTEVPSSLWPADKLWVN